jgi:putative oxidoreductase
MKTLRTLFKTDGSYTPLVARLALGLAIFPHGAQKALGWFGGYGFGGTMNFFTGQMHIPALFAFLAIAAEFAGAIGLITGFISRVAAFGIATTMLVAAVMVHVSNGFFMNWLGNQKGEGFEYHILAVGLALIIILAGGGKWSVDLLLSRTESQKLEFNRSKETAAIVAGANLVTKGEK